VNDETPPLRQFVLARVVRSRVKIKEKIRRYLHGVYN